MAQQQGLVRAADRQDFVRNALVVIAPVDAKAPPAALKDLAGPGVTRVALSAPASVPVGRYGKRALEAAGLWAAVQPRIIHTTNVRQSLDYVARAEVDVGFVYATDAALMKDKVKTVFDVPLDMAILYPIARTAASSNATEAAAFIAYVRSPAGQAILARYGFLKP